MRRRLPWILLAVSLVLNAGFVAGFLHARNVLQELRTPDGRARWASKRLKLNPEQRRAFDRIHEAWSGRLRQVARENDTAIEAFWNEMLQEKRDHARAREILDRLLPIQNDVIRSSVDALEQMLAGLTPEQRRQYVKLLRSRGNP